MIRQIILATLAAITFTSCAPKTHTFNGEFEAKIDINGDGHKDFVYGRNIYTYFEQTQISFTFGVNYYNPSLEGYLPPKSVTIKEEVTSTIIEDTDLDGDMDIQIITQSKDSYFFQDL